MTEFKQYQRTQIAELRPVTEADIQNKDKLLPAALYTTTNGVAYLSKKRTNKCLSKNSQRELANIFE